MRTDYTVWCSIGGSAGQDREAAGGGVRAYPTVEDEQWRKGLNTHTHTHTHLLSTRNAQYTRTPMDSE